MKFYEFNSINDGLSLNMEFVVTSNLFLDINETNCKIMLYVSQPTNAKLTNPPNFV